MNNTPAMPQELDTVGNGSFARSLARRTTPAPKADAVLGQGEHRAPPARLQPRLGRCERRRQASSVNRRNTSLATTTLRRQFPAAPTIAGQWAENGDGCRGRPIETCRIVGKRIARLSVKSLRMQGIEIGTGAKLKLDGRDEAGRRYDELPTVVRALHRRQSR